MGLSTNFAPIVFELLSRVERRDAVLTLGRVTLEFDSKKANDMLEVAGFGRPLEAGSPLDDQILFRAMGFKAVESLDVSDFEGATKIFDLNTRPLPKALIGQFDMVIDAGTMEHVFRIDCGFANCREMLRPGGRLLSVSPMNNYVDHGFYQFSPTLFADIAYANGLEVEAAFEVEIHPRLKPEQSRAEIRTVLPGDFGQVGALNANPRLFVSMLRRTEASTSDALPIQAYYRKLFANEPGADKTLEQRRSFTVIDGIMQPNRHDDGLKSSMLYEDPESVDRVILSPDAFRPGPYGGAQWVVDLPEQLPVGDSGHPMTSALRLFEDGIEMTSRHCGHQEIADLGKGRFSHWGDVLYFSSSDGSSPTENGRVYSCFWDEALHKNLMGVVKLGISRPPPWSEVPQVVLSGPVEEPLDQLPLLVERIRAVSLQHLDEESRFILSEALAHAAYPTFRFSEFGRSFLTKDATFWDDYTRFMDTGNWHSHDRKYTLKELLKLTRKVAGHFAECGVYKGGSAHLMCREASAQGRRVHLFDSFEGLSEPGPNDGAYWQAGRLAVSEEKVAAALSDWTCFDLFKGWIPDSFVEVANERYAFVHLDLDLEVPTQNSLSFFLPRMNSGGVILLDDYGFDSCPGVKHAADTFFASRPEDIISLPTGQAFVIIQ